MIVLDSRGLVMKRTQFCLEEFKIYLERDSNNDKEVQKFSDRKGRAL